MAPVEGQSSITFEDVQFAAVAASGIGDNQVVNAVAGKQVKVLSYVLVAAGAVSVQWQDDGGANLSGVMALAANGQVNPSGGSDAIPLLVTAVGQGLDLNLSAAVAVGGHITYIVE